MAKSLKNRFRKRIETIIKKQKREGVHLKLPAGVSLYKPKEGKNLIDVISYEVKSKNNPGVLEGDIEVGEHDAFLPYLLHRNIGPDNKTVVCLRTVGKKCPICALYNKLRNSATVDEEVVKALRPKDRSLFNVVRGDEVQVWDISTFCFTEMLLKELQDEDAEDKWFEFASAKGGSTLSVRFAKKSMGTTEFLEADKLLFKDRKDIPASIAAKAVDLDGVLNILSFEEMEELLNSGHIEGDDLPFDDDFADEDEEEEKSKKKGKAKAAPVVEEEEEEEVEDIEEDEDEEEEPEPEPVKKKAKAKAKAKAKPVVVEEDDEDDEEEVPAPPKKKAKAKPAPVIVEDEEEEDEEDEEEDIPTPPPAKKKKKVIVVEDEDDEEEEEAPAPPKNKGKSAAAKPAGKSRCPQGWKFGTDIYMIDDSICAECPLEDECGEASATGL